MAQLATVLPGEESNTLAGAEGGVLWSTTVFDGSTGLEARYQAWTTPRQTWALTYIGLSADLADVLDLFNEAKGRGLSFLFTPPGGAQGDYRFGSDELRVNYQRGAAGLIGSLTISVVEVLDE